MPGKRLLSSHFETQFPYRHTTSSKVKVTVGILGKGYHGPNACLWTDFDITSHKYDNTWDKCAFQHCRSKVNVTDLL